MDLDKFRDVDLVVDHVNDSFFSRQFVSQNDNDGRTLTVLITNGGVVGEVPGLSVNLRWTNQASGLTDLSAFELIDKATSKFQIKYPKNMLNPGKVIASIQIIQNGQVAHSKQFEITVQQLAGEAKGIIEKAEYGALVKTLSAANKFQTGIDNLGMTKADKVEIAKVEDMISKMPSATPKETFTSLSALKTKYPNGNASAMVVLEADGKTGYVYLWNGSEWQKGALYQSQGIADKSLQKRKLGVGVLKTEGSENLCKYENIFWGGYVSWNTGLVGANDNYCHVIVPIDPSKKYLVQGTNEQGCFKDINGVYISGYQRVTEFPEIPVNAAYLWQTVKTSQIDDTYIGLDDGVLVAPEVLDLRAVKDESIPMVKNEAVPFLSADFNAFNPETVRNGVYIYWFNGQEDVLAGYSASAMIPIDPRVGWEVVGTTEQLAYYDSFSRYLGGLTKASTLKDTILPGNTRWIRLSMKDPQINDVVLRPVQKLDNDWITEANALKIGEILEMNDTNTIHVKKDGSGDYTSLKQALNNSGEKTVIKVYDDFRLEEEYSEAEIKAWNFQGYPLRKKQTIEGVGDVTISANLDTSIFSADDIKRVSTITPLGDGNLKNLTLVGESVRYAFHPETESNNLYCENVTFIKKNSGTYCQAMAGGTRSGQHHSYKNCTFITEWTRTTDVPASYHTNVNFSLPCSIKFEDCRFQSVNSAYELRLGGMASNQLNIVELIGNRLSSVLVKEERMDGVGLDYLFRGRGNRQLTFTQQSQSGSESAQYDFVEEIHIV